MLFDFSTKKKQFLTLALSTTVILSLVLITMTGLFAKSNHIDNNVGISNGIMSYKINSENDDNSDTYEIVSTAPSLTIQGKHLDNDYENNGKELHMWITVRQQDGSIVKSDFTPLTLSGISGSTYSVTASDYSAGGLYFNHWSSGSTSKSISIALNGDDVQLEAYYGKTKPGQLSLSQSSIQGPIGSAKASQSDTAASPLITKTGIFVPLYMYPGTKGSVHWQTVIDEKYKHPSVPVVAVFNPSSGPGNSLDSNIANWVAKLQSAGIIALGYTHDDYGSRLDSALKSDADKYRNWYNADGLFIDEFANYAGSENHYQEVTNYAKSIGMKMTMGNPGADVPQSYLGTVDVINIVEGKGYPPISKLQYCFNCSPEQGWHYKVDKRNFAYMGYDIGSLDTAFVSESSKWVGLIYLTDGNDSNARWFNVPSYYSSLVSTLDG